MRKQFRMYNLYKSIVDGLHDEVRYIVYFRTDGDYVSVKFADGDTLSFSIRDFDAKRVAIRHINRKLKELRQYDARNEVIQW